jgi:hypothetical protein
MVHVLFIEIMLASYDSDVNANVASYGNLCKRLFMFMDILNNDMA